jgi:hypothetical protein
VIVPYLLYMIYSIQLQHRLLKMSIEYHETINNHQQRERFLVQSLCECSAALEKALMIIRRNNGVDNVPADLTSIAAKYREMLEQINSHSA